MSVRIQAIRGMNDILPDATPHWQQLEELMSEDHVAATAVD